MAAHYTALAPIYDTIGLSAFTRRMVPQILDYAQRNDWLGRRIVDLGCGTGAAAIWFAEEGYSVVAVDQSAEMLQVGQRYSEAHMGLALEWAQADIRNLANVLSPMDMILAMDVLNELESIKDIQTVFAQVYQVMESGKLFAFDLYTIEGLAKRAQPPEQILFNNEQLFLLASNQFDYERQTATRNFTVFEQREPAHWQRTDAQRILRGYPLQALVTLLQRSGFSNINVLGEDMQPLSSRRETPIRVIFVVSR